ncbi:MAG: hypothetical protein ACE1ZE_08365, partial [Candidatus Binatia bacterium]
SKPFLNQSIIPGQSLRGTLKKAVCRLVKKISEARRAKNRRAEAYLGGTLERLCLERENFPGRLSATFKNASLKQAVGI